jgi:serine/threonine protein kinase
MPRINDIENGYTFLKKLGEGTYGQVWKAKDSNGNIVAIKCFKTDIDDLESEYDALIDISTDCSEYAVCYKDRYTYNDMPRLVIEYIDGNTADSIMDSSINLNGNYLFPYCLIKGIDVLHKLDISHQDIKLQNIMFDNNTGKFRYIDWGLACLKKYCPDDGVCTYINCKTSGPLVTMPPELQFGFENKSTFKETQAHDYWSIGVTILNFYRVSRYNAELYKYKDQTKIEEYLNNLHKNYPKVFTTELMNIVSYLLEIDSNKRYNNFKKVLRLVNEFKLDTLNPDIFKSQVELNSSSSNLTPLPIPGFIQRANMPNNDIFTFKTNSGDKSYTLDYLLTNGKLINNKLHINGKVYKITPLLLQYLN